MGEFICDVIDEKEVEFPLQDYNDKKVYFSYSLAWRN
jgi:hypothetical protein